MTDLMKGKRILVVEDEYLIAADLRRVLTARGATVIGPTGTFSSALTLAGEELIDAALVDINLGDIMSYPIVDRLIARNVPYLFLTGYDQWAVPDAYRDAPRLDKPAAAELVISKLASLLTLHSRA